MTLSSLQFDLDVDIGIDLDFQADLHHDLDLGLDLNINLDLASHDLCGSSCEIVCQGAVRDLTEAQLASEVYVTLAEMAVDGPVALEEEGL